MDLNIDFLKKRPLSLVSNSSTGSQMVILNKSENKRLGGSFSGSSEGGVSDDTSIRHSIRFSSEPYLSNIFETSIIKSSSLCDFYEYYYDQFLTAKSKKSSNYCLLENKSEKDESSCSTSLRNIINELIETENSYVNDLLNIINGYLVPMEQNGQVSRREITLIFANITSLFSFNQALLKELRECGKNVEKIASTFIKNQHKFLLYSSYCSNYPRCLETIERCMSKECSRQLLTTLQSNLTHQLPLAAFLLKPIQRISKYHLFFQNIINCYSAPSTKPPQRSSTPRLPQLRPSPRQHKRQTSSTSLQPRQPSPSFRQHKHSTSSLQQPSIITPQKQSKPHNTSTLKSSRTTPTSNHISLKPTTPQTPTVSAEQAAIEALTCMNQVLDHINQTNTLRKQYNNTHLRKDKNNNNKKAFNKPNDIGDLLFKEKFYEEEGKKSVYHLFLFSKAVLVTRKRSRNKHLVKVFFETKDVVLLEDVRYHPTCFYLISTLNNKQHIKLEARNVEQKVNCCHQIKRVVSCDVSKYFDDQILVSCLTDTSSIISKDKKERIIDKSSIISIEGTHSNSVSHKKFYNRTDPNLESTPNYFNSTSHNLSQLKTFSMLVNSKKKACIDVQGSPETFEKSNNNYLFTLKLPRRSKKNTRQGILTGYREAKCTDICMEGCEGVYKKLPLSSTSPHQNHHHPESNPQENNHHSSIQLHQNHFSHSKISTSHLHNNVDTSLNRYEIEKVIDPSGVQCLDFYYEDKLHGDLDNISVTYDDSDFEDSIFSDDSSISSPHLTPYAKASFGQCLESAF